jgi:hypothetical protein
MEYNGKMMYPLEKKFSCTLSIHKTATQGEKYEKK